MWTAGTGKTVESQKVGDRVSQGALTGTVHTVGPEFSGSGGMPRTGLNSTRGRRWCSSVSIANLPDLNAGPYYGRRQRGCASARDHGWWRRRTAELKSPRLRSWCALRTRSGRGLVSTPSWARGRFFLPFYELVHTSVNRLAVETYSSVVGAYSILHPRHICSPGFSWGLFHFAAPSVDR